MAWSPPSAKTTSPPWVIVVTPSVVAPPGGPSREVHPFHADKGRSCHRWYTPPSRIPKTTSPPPGIRPAATLVIGPSRDSQSLHGDEGVGFQAYHAKSSLSTTTRTGAPSARCAAASSVPWISQVSHGSRGVTWKADTRSSAPILATTWP